MAHRSADSLDERTAWSADESDDSMEFAEFAPAEANADVAAEEHEAPAWFRRRDTDAGDAEPEAADADLDEMEFASVDDGGDAADVSEPEESDSPAEPTIPPPLPGRKKRRGGKAAGSKLPRIEVDKSRPSPLAWTALVLLAIKDGTAGSLGVSLAVHSVIALLLAIVVKESLDQNEAISMTITETDAMPIEFEEIEDLSVDFAGGSEMQVPQFQDVPLQNDSALISNAADLMSFAGSGEGEGGDEGFGFKFKMPTGGKAVSAGSFSAWTVPEDPKPGQDYMIVIRIKVPKGATSYRVSDLSGQIVGTDGYVLKVPVDSNPSRSDRTKTERAGRLVPVKLRDRLRVMKGHVQLMVDVPGAASLTRDTIQLKSKLLKEEQKLEIVF